MWLKSKIRCSLLYTRFIIAEIMISAVTLADMSLTQKDTIYGAHPTITGFPYILVQSWLRQ